MTDWFNSIGLNFMMRKDAAQKLQESGFVVLPGPLMGNAMGPLAAAYDRALMKANPDEVAVGRTTTRLHDLVNRGAEFGHTVNRSNESRRSIQGVFIQRDARYWSGQNIHMRPETMSRVGDLANYLLEQ